MYEMRERMAKELGFELLVHQNPEAVAKGHQSVRPRLGPAHRHVEDRGAETGAGQVRLRRGLRRRPARRGEVAGQGAHLLVPLGRHRWDPKAQRPELWKLYNTRKSPGESIRVFPISNWTELDIWQYIHLENIPIVPLYYAAERPVVERDGQLIMVDDDRMPLKPGETPQMRSVGSGPWAAIR
jgi:sulfate adenylyltransferase subunit 2